MRSEQFWPGDKVMILGNDENVPIGTEGSVVSRWIGTLYAVRLADGTFHWMDSSELESIDPSRHSIAVGDIAKVTSNKHSHDFARMGSLVQVVKVVDEADYYGVVFNDTLDWFAGLELASYRPFEIP